MKTMKVTLYVQYNRTLGVQVFTVLLAGSVLIETQEIEVSIPEHDEHEIVIKAIKAEIDEAKKNHLKGLEKLESELEKAQCQNK